MSELNQLTRLLDLWIRRLRIQRGVTWAVRGFAFGLGVALLVGGFFLYRAEIVRSEFLLATIFSSLVFPLLFGMSAYLWRIRPLEAARFFDRRFGLGERVSTAFELRGAGNDLAQKQLDDALRFARKVKPARGLPFRFKKVDGVLALIFLVAIAALWFRGDALFTAAQNQRDVEVAIAEQQAKIEEIIKEIEANDSLSDEQKEALSAPLEDALQKLKETQTLAGGVSVLTTTGEQMQAMSETQGGQTMQALKEAGSALAGQEGSPLEALGKDLASGNFASAAAELANMDLSQMSAEELQQTAEQLEALADQLQSTNPQMAENLRNAAEKIRAGDLAAAQQALSQAGQQMAQVAQQAAASQAAGQISSQLSAGAQQLLAAGGGQTAQANQGQQGQPGNNPNEQNNQGGAGGGSGSGDAPDSNQPGGEAGSSPIPQNNGAGDGGESTYEQIYAPPLLDGAGGDTLGLPTAGNEGEVIGESPVTATDGQSLVPYSDVYSQYQSVNNQAIENGEVPAQFMDVIWSYFNSIQP